MNAIPVTREVVEELFRRAQEPSEYIVIGPAGTASEDTVVERIDALTATEAIAKQTTKGKLYCSVGRSFDQGGEAN